MKSKNVGELVFDMPLVSGKIFMQAIWFLKGIDAWPRNIGVQVDQINKKPKAKSRIAFKLVEGG